MAIKKRNPLGHIKNLISFPCLLSAPPKFVVAHSGPVTGRTKESVDLVCEAVGDDHIR